MNKTVNKMMAIGVGVTMMLATGVSTTFAATASDVHDVVITVTERAMLALSSKDDVTFTIDVIDGGVAGDPIEVIDSANVDNKYLFYTSIVAGKDFTREITVQINDATKIPAGTTLSVLPAAPAAAGQGGKGTAVGTAIDLSTAATAAVDLVTGIKSCSTGKSTGNGVQLTYDLAIDDETDAVAALVAAEYTVIVTYTLTESAL